MRKVPIAAITIILLITLLPAVCADDDSMKVLLFAGNPDDDYTYEVGDTVPLEVRVFDKGQPTDADTSPAVTLNRYDSNERKISVQRIGTGAYSGSFTIMNSDVDEYISVRAEATLGKENETDYLYDDDSDYDNIHMSGEWGLDVELKFDNTHSSGITASPGDVIDMTITVKYDGVNVNPDNFDLTADNEPFAYTNPSKGVFKASYKVSSTVLESTSIYIDAEAEYDGEIDKDGGDIDVNIFSIWYHSVSITDSYAQFELCVSDMEGKAISGAEIDIDYEINYNSEDSGSKSGVTDSSGKASFSILHDSASNIWIEGSAESSGRSQKFYGNIDLGEDESSSEIKEPSPLYNFEVIYQENAGEIKTGETVTLEYIAYSEANTLPNQPIYYYIHSDEEFINSGSITTDSKGKFWITFKTPETSTSICLAFESPFDKENTWEHCDCDDGLVYREDYDYVFVYDESSMGSVWGERDSSITIKTSTLKIGGKTRITATMPDSKDCESIAIVIPIKYTLETLDVSTFIESKWNSWTGPSNYFLIYEGDKFTCEVLLPEFLPKDETYTVMVFFQNPNESPSGYHWNYAHVRPGESVEGEEEQNVLLQSPLNVGGIGIPWLAIIIIIAIILVALIAGIKRRASAKAASSDKYPMRSYPESYSQRTYQGPYSPRSSQQPEAYQRSYPRYDRHPETTPKVIFQRANQRPYEGRYPQRPAIYQRQYTQTRRYAQPPSPPRQPSTVEGVYPMRDSVVGVTCSACGSQFYVQGKKPPFKTVCPYCNRDNIVV